MGVDSNGLFDTLDAEMALAVSSFLEMHCGASAPLFFSNAASGVWIVQFKCSYCSACHTFERKPALLMRSKILSWVP